MKISNSRIRLHLNEYGSLVSISNGKREFIKRTEDKSPLFTIRFRNEKGEHTDISSLMADGFSYRNHEGEGGKEIELSYSNFSIIELSVKVYIRLPDDEPFSYWKLSLENKSELYVDWIDFPAVTVPNDLVANGGKSRILWPGMEGCLVEDASFRDKSFVKYAPVEYPNKGWEGYYPGPCPVQMMAYYNDQGGLYLAAHDKEHNVKAIEFVPEQNGIKLEYKLFPGAVTGAFKMSYEMVIGVFEGDWYNAADIYRNWVEKNEVIKYKKLYENDNLPQWIHDSPVIAIYPVRGEKDTGDMSFNKDYYPFTNALPHIKRLSLQFDSKIMALLMHWEGTAPWSPPYVWPPLGGEKKFEEFVEGLHKQGNLAGVYCSGLGWTNESGIIPEYSRREQFEKQNLIEVMCDSPKGDSPEALICQGPIRTGYDMCPANKFVQETAVSEVLKIAGSGCDYIQFFDQNLGGASYFCYSKKHGHDAPAFLHTKAYRKSQHHTLMQP